MNEIDRPFRFTWDFCLVWTVLAVITAVLTRHGHFAEWYVTWYARVALIIVCSLFATFVLYGPVLLARQVIHSGLRGWFVLRVLISTLLALGLLSGILLATGIGNQFGGHLWGGIFAFGTTFYLNWRINTDISRK